MDRFEKVVSDFHLNLCRPVGYWIENLNHFHASWERKCVCNGINSKQNFQN